MDPTDASDPLQAAGESKPLQLLDLPNETLLAIAARVPFSPETIITLKLVNRQLHHLLTDGASLKQLRNDIAKVQYLRANLFRIPTENHTFESLQELKDDTTAVTSISRQIQASSTSGVKTDLLTVGLHLFAAIGRVGIKVLSEAEVTWILLVLGAPLVALMRLVSIQISRFFRDKHSKSNPSLSRLFSSSSAPLVIENMIVRFGLVAMENLVLAESADTSNMGDFVTTLVIHKHGIDYALDFFTAYMAHQEISQSSGSEFIDMVRRSRGLRPSWALVATGLLTHDTWLHDLCLESDEHKDKVKALHNFCVPSASAQDGTAAIEDVNEATAHGKRVSDLRELDWHDFVQRQLSSIMDRTLPKRPGVLAVRIFQVMLGIRREGLLETSPAAMKNRPPYVYFLRLWDTYSKEFAIFSTTASKTT